MIRRKEMMPPMGCNSTASNLCVTLSNSFMRMMVSEIVFTQCTLSRISLNDGGIFGIDLVAS
ncbi:MAG: hypothetical protein EBU66_04425 [Bacteroidetes bacterium]|nr:hypothetical protein [Bacteroidota bacterium]